MVESIGATDELLAELVEFRLQRQVERFLYREAELMDSHQFDEWLALWSEDCLYWMPSPESEKDAVHNVSVIYDRRKDLEHRIGRLRGRFAFAQQPKSRLTRVLSNIVVGEEQGGQVTVTSKFVLGELRQHRTNVLFGVNEHSLRRFGEGFQIVQKKVTIINNDSAMTNMVYLI